MIGGFSVKRERVYVCHTFYHVYVTILKELNLPKEKQGRASILLSTMSNDFGNLKDRLEECSIFEEVYMFEEKKPEFFSELDTLKRDRGNILLNMISRIKFCKKFAKLQEPYIPVDFTLYREIYVYCDSDPVGYYLNANRIYYYALEDGLNCISYLDTARFDNRGAFALKAWLSKNTNLIFIQNGYGKYCIDMEVNDISMITHSCPFYRQQKIREYVTALSLEQKKLMLTIFVKNFKELLEQLQTTKQGAILILTEPLCDLETRKRIFRDIIEQYESEGTIVIKPHPRDVLDYEKEFAAYSIIDKTVPMEMLNFIPDVVFQKVISVFTETKSIDFAKESIKLGPDFMDAYESPELHRHNELI